MSTEAWVEIVALGILYTFLGFLGLLGLMVLAWLLATLRELLRFPVSKRQAKPEGRLVSLARGLTHVSERGPSDGETIVFVHGLTTPSFVFDVQARILAERGYRVITYDHYGRGLSDRPRGVQTTQFFRSHLHEMLAAIGVQEPVTVVGYSMGGAIAADYAAAFPDQVKSAILIAPAGMRSGLGGWAQRWASVPVVGDVVFHLFYPRIHRKGVDAERNLQTAVPNIFDRQVDELRYRGFLSAVLASFRGVLRHSLAPEHRRLAQSGVAVSAIWAAGDDVIPLSGKDTLAEWNPTARNIVVPDAGHGLVYTHADSVLDILLELIGEAAPSSD